jgi:histidine ammonia-lyase
MRLQTATRSAGAPHVIGVLLDNLPHIERRIETELNSTNDNPIFDLETGDVLPRRQLSTAVTSARPWIR